MDETSQPTPSQPQFNATTVVQPSSPRRFPILLTAIFIIILGALGGGGAWLYMQQQNQITQLNTQVADLRNQLAAIPTYEYTSAKGVKMFVYMPKSGATVTSPIMVVGVVPGNWSQEANFPVQIKNSQGAVIQQTYATVHGDWMTSDLQPFTAKVTFTADQVGDGTLVLQNANPSGLPDKADSVSVPIKLNK